MNKNELGYCITRKELLAIYRFTKKFRHYLIGRKFIVRCDHQALKWLLDWKNPNTSQDCSWRAELEEFDMQIEYRKGKYHQNADALSRLEQCEQCHLKHIGPKKKRNVKILRVMNTSNIQQEHDPDIKIVFELLKMKKKRK